MRNNGGGGVNNVLVDQEYDWAGWVEHGPFENSAWANHTGKKCAIFLGFAFVSPGWFTPSKGVQWKKGSRPTQVLRAGSRRKRQAWRGGKEKKTPEACFTLEVSRVASLHWFMGAASHFRHCVCWLER